MSRCEPQQPDDEFDDGWFGDPQDDTCPDCGGEGCVEYMDCSEAWGEDRPSEENYLMECPACRGTGLIQ